MNGEGLLFTRLSNLLLLNSGAESKDIPICIWEWPELKGKGLGTSLVYFELSLLLDLMHTDRKSVV